MSDFRKYLIFLLYTCSHSYASADCPDGFVKHGESCYHFSHDTETWLDAVDACDKLYGAYLTEIQDTAENSFLQNQVELLKFNYWIGGNDLQVEGDWKWFTSKADVTLNAWTPGNPSNSNDNENCMEYHDPDVQGPMKPMWNDNACHAFQRYICEKTSSETEIIG